MSGSARNKIRKISVSSLDNGAISSSIRVGGDTGLNYAHATGDWNPHHLYPWTAKLLGYRQPIAHGMWVLGKMIALIQSGQKLENYPISIEALFRRPLFMPGKVDFKYSKTSSNRYDFRVIDTETAVPHLTGSVVS
ncbi:hypothetical protein LOTGIDRAFT_175639 [Lottia gigantea]|uniref:MaoC-like domain-containing protein n=1 Tax=Lottia gigantea TaxID=225164 RepID=V4ACW1_LOTGI|nr:hypothetical protein LOTGIDRAFT_175639 [Lottia gigantea]ESO92930.1 hypothetical protein LOTGIDRAFT_175639 [Lottia gigantea]